MRPSPGLFVFVVGLLYLMGPCLSPTTVLRSNPAPEVFPVGVSALSLTRHPQVHAGKRIRVLIAARTYRTIPTGIVWEEGHPRSPPLFIHCAPPPGCPSLDVIGTCRGQIGQVVVIDTCTVEVIPTLPPLRGAWAQR